MEIIDNKMKKLKENTDKQEINTNNEKNNKNSNILQYFENLSQNANENSKSPIIGSHQQQKSNIRNFNNNNFNKETENIIKSTNPFINNTYDEVNKEKDEKIISLTKKLKEFELKSEKENKERQCIIH